MREARTDAELLAWHTAALALRDDWQDKNRARIGVTEEPQCGWFRAQGPSTDTNPLSGKPLYNGPWVPARIWISQVVDEDGELTEPAVMHCEIDGQARDPDEVWLFLCKQPITQREFDYLTRLRAWQRVNAPEELTAPRKIDHLSTPVLEE